MKKTILPPAYEWDRLKAEALRAKTRRAVHRPLALSPMIYHRA